MDAIGNNSINSILQQVGSQAVNPIPSTQTGAGSKEEIAKKAKEFESVFISEMLRLMFEDVKADPLYGTTAADTIYRDMLLNKFGEKISDAGGFGIAHHVEVELLKLQEVQ